MDDIQAHGLDCRAPLILPMPDAWESPDGEVLNASDMDDDDNLEEMRRYLHTLACPAKRVTTSWVIVTFGDAGGRAG